MLLCGIATQAVSMLKLGLLKGEFCVPEPATRPLVGKQLFVIDMFLHCIQKFVCHCLCLSTRT